MALRKVHAIVDLALMIQKRFNALKGPSRLDNGDLLMKCAEALKDNPSIAQAYRDRFKLIMIDEFQDTDKLQVSIVERIARPSFGNVCTVGGRAAKHLPLQRGGRQRVLRVSRDVASPVGSSSFRESSR